MCQDLCFMPATEMIDRYRDRSLSPVEVTEAVLTQIETYDPAINAFVVTTSELARQQARFGRLAANASVKIDAA